MTCFMLYTESACCKPSHAIAIHASLIFANDARRGTRKYPAVLPVFGFAEFRWAFRSAYRNTCLAPYLLCLLEDCYLCLRSGSGPVVRPTSYHAQLPGEALCRVDGRRFDWARCIALDWVTSRRRRAPRSWADRSLNMAASIVLIDRTARPSRGRFVGP